MASAAEHTRWIAYDATVEDADNTEVEPGNTRTRTARWSNAQPSPHPIDGWRGFQQADEATNKPTFSASTIVHRTLSFTGAQPDVTPIHHSVHFLPRDFLDLPTSLTADVLASLVAFRSSAVASLADELISADTLTSDAYSRFRFVWMLARDGASVQSAHDLRQFTAHTNLFAPIVTHDHKAFVQKVIKKLMPTQSTDAAPLPASQLQASLARNGDGLLPQIPFACDITDPRAMLLELLQTMVHAQMCRTMDWNLDTRTAATPGVDEASWIETFRSAWNASSATVLSWLKIHLAQRSVYLNFIVRCYRELMPPKTLLQVLESCFPVDWMDITFQNGLVRHVLRDPLSAQYPPSVDQRFDFWKTLCTVIESHVCLEVQDEILAHLQLLTQEKLRTDHTQPLITHWTVAYRDACDLVDDATSSDAAPSEPLQTCTLRLESGFSSTTGCSLWPAGMLMCDFILANRHIFAGKRVLELGVGIGLTTIMLHRAGAATLVCTDCDDKALRNLHTNFEINGVPVVSTDSDAASDVTPFGPGVFIANLDWCSPDRSLLLRRSAPDVVISCDCIYLPELHDALGGVVLESLQIGAAAAATSASASTPCAYFAQMNRNPATFSHYLDTFGQLGLAVDSQSSAAHALPSRFAYDRDAIELHRFTIAPNAD